MGGDIEEYPFIFMNTPASLQNLASVEMALTLWRYKYAKSGHLYDKPRLFFEQKFNCKKLLVVPVPHLIAAQIDEKIASIGEELCVWIDFHSDRDFLDADSTEAFRKCLKHIVVDFSGFIGCKASAMNMLNSGEFSDVVNYKLACMYCLENEVKRFWPSVANESRIDVNSEHDKCNLSYWNGWMKSGGNSITDIQSVKRLVKKAALRRDDVTAFDYFCKMLPGHERVYGFIWLLLHDHPTMTHSLLLCTLDRLEAEKVFKMRASSIFKVLTKNDKNFGYAHRLWHLMGHLSLENKSQFYNVVFELWILVFFPYHLDGLNYTQYGEVNNLLLEIWSHASDELKAYVSKAFVRDELLDLTEATYEFSRPTRYGHDMTFLLEVMSQLRGWDKERWWKRNWCALALRSKPMQLELFMQICLPNHDAIEFFKFEIANFNDLFESLIEDAFYADLNDYLTFCTKDEKQRQQLGKKVLESNLHVILLHDDEKFARFEWFVGEVFANVQKDVEEFKIAMISSSKCLKRLLAARRADKIGSNGFSRVVGRFVTNEGELQQVKRKLFEHCRTYPVNCSTKKFNADQWQEFFEWCTGDHEEITAFKRSLNVDVIFQKRLKDYLDGKCYGGCLEFLDNFLKWYFGNVDAAKNFKLEKVKNYKEIDILRVEIEKEFIYVEGSLYRLLVWLFDGNIENVGEFFKTCNIIPRLRTIKVRERSSYF